MVLVSEGTSLSPRSLNSLSDLYSLYPKILSRAKLLVSIPPTVVQPEGVIYVRQKGYAISYPGDRLPDGARVSSVGTEDVLTCHVIVLRYDRVTALGHFDEYVSSETLDKMIIEFEKIVRQYGEEYHWEDGEWEWEEYEDGNTSEEEESFDQKKNFLSSSTMNNFSFAVDFQIVPISLQVLGGYSDEAGKAQRLGRRLFNYFHKHPYAFEVKDVCLGDLNTKRGIYKKEPIIGGVLCDINTGTLSNAVFSSRAFLCEMTDEIVNKLLLGPSLIKKPNTLKKLILAKEDRGYAL